MDPFRLCLSVLTSCCSSGSPGSFPVSLKINGWHSCRPYNLIPHYPEKAFWEIVEERGGFSFPECMQAQLSQSSPTICDPMDCSLQGFFVHEILQIRILEWVAMTSSRGSSHPGIEPGSPVLQTNSLLLSHQGSSLFPRIPRKGLKFHWLWVGHVLIHEPITVTKGVGTIIDGNSDRLSLNLRMGRSCTDLASLRVWVAPWIMFSAISRG